MAIASYFAAQLVTMAHGKIINWNQHHSIITMGNIIFQISKTTHLGHPPTRDLDRDGEHNSDLSPCNSHEIDVCADEEDQDFVIVNGTDPCENNFNSADPSGVTHEVEEEMYDNEVDQNSTEDFVFVAHGSYESASML